MALIPREDPYSAFNFIVEMTLPTGTKVNGAFMEVSNLEAEIAVIDYRTGDAKQQGPRKLHGIAKYKAVTFKRGIIGDAKLWEWIVSTVEGKQERVNVDVLLHDEAGTEVMHWQLTRCWASKWTGPSLNAKTSEVALETLELQVEKVVIVK